MGGNTDKKGEAGRNRDRLRLSDKGSGRLMEKGCGQKMDGAV